MTLYQLKSWDQLLMSDMNTLWNDIIGSTTEEEGGLNAPLTQVLGDQKLQREREVKQGNFMQKNFQTCTIKHNFNS